MGVDPAEWRTVLGLASAGEITLDPDVGQAVQAACDKYLDELGTVLRMADTVKLISGFGGFESGQALQTKFQQKATGTDQSIDAVIMQHIEVVKLAKQVVAQAIANIVEADQSNADGIAGAGESK
jgi:hypothetical protein